MNRQKNVILVFLLPALWLCTFTTGALASEDYYTMVDLEGNTIMMSEMAISKGDMYLTSDNRKYEVISVEDNTAQAIYLGTIDLEKEIRRLSETLKTDVGEQTSKRPIGIYHTHSGESYRPSDGVDNIAGEGGVVKVGASVASAIEKDGIPAVHSKQLHDPHDTRSYDRSRATALSLLRDNNAIALLDIHRDAIPAEQYTMDIGGESVARIRLVVGRRNPHMSANEHFALQLKSATDKRYPNLIKGIFYANGTYNQDVAPRAVLIEAGTHTNTRDQAVNGMQLFLDATLPILSATTASSAERQGLSTSVWWAVGIVAVGIFLFLLLNKGSFQDLVNAIKRRMGTDFAGAIGVNPDDDNKEQDNDE
jgi:stage II sporulation protein P